MKRLQGKVAVVTGGNSGIGLASAQRLKEEGAKVAITGRSQKTLDEPCLGKNLKMVRDRGGGDATHFHQGAAVHAFVGRDLLIDFQPSLVGQRLGDFFNLGQVHSSSPSAVNSLPHARVSRIV